MAMDLRLQFFSLLFAFLFIVSSEAQSAAPAPAVDCGSLVLKMSECLPFVTEGGAAMKPEGGCCSGLKTVLKTNAGCLCEAFKNSAQLGLKLNVSKALTLPDACHVSAPSISNCGLRIGSVAAPALSPLAIPPSSVAGAPTSVTGVNAVSPAPSPGSSGVSSVSSSGGMFILSTTIVAASLFALF